MATRIEKKFKSNTICLMNFILNEINSLIDYKATNKQKVSEFVNASKRITHSICKFYDSNNITDEEIKKAINQKGNYKCP